MTHQIQLPKTKRSAQSSAVEVVGVREVRGESHLRRGAQQNEEMRECVVDERLPARE